MNNIKSGVLGGSWLDFVDVLYYLYINLIFQFFILKTSKTCALFHKTYSTFGLRS